MKTESVCYQIGINNFSTSPQKKILVYIILLFICQFLNEKENIIETENIFMFKTVLKKQTKKTCFFLRFTAENFLKHFHSLFKKIKTWYFLTWFLRRFYERPVILFFVQNIKIWIINYFLCTTIFSSFNTST